MHQRRRKFWRKVGMSCCAQNHGTNEREAGGRHCIAATKKWWHCCGVSVLHGLTAAISGCVVSQRHCLPPATLSISFAFDVFTIGRAGPPRPRPVALRKSRTAYALGAKRVAMSRTKTVP